MFDRIRKKLEAQDNAGWELTQEQTRRWEFYFIRHELDQNRAVDTTEYKVKVYRSLEDGKYLGSSSGMLSPGASEQEMDKLLADLYFRAGYVKNPVYKLVDRPLPADVSGMSSGEEPGQLPGTGSCETAQGSPEMWACETAQGSPEMEACETAQGSPKMEACETTGISPAGSSGRPVDLAAISRAFLQAVQEVPETGTEDINSYEIFVREIRRRFLNSNGVSYACVYPSSMAEVVVNARKDGHEIEIYRNFTSGTCDGENLKIQIRKAMQTGRDRLDAVPTPKQLDGTDILFTGSNAVDLYRYFVNRMSASFQVHKLSDWKCGESVFPAQHADTITVEAVPTLSNSSRNFPVDEEGSLICQRYLIKDGIAASYWGSRQMSQYMGLEESSIVYNTVADGGTRTEEELRQGDYLEVVEFSDFQVDAVGGDLAGEIRLAYWHHDGKTIPVTGGSLSGSMTEVLKTMQISRKTEQFDTCVIPALTRVRGLKVTGVE